MKELKMMIGGGADTDGLTAVAAHVREGDTFLSNGSDEIQTGTLIDRSKINGMSIPSLKLPLFAPEAVKILPDSNGDTRVMLEPPSGDYPGGTKGAYIGVLPGDIGVTAEKVASGQTAAGVKGTYGSDGTVTASDMKAGVIGYGSAGKVTGKQTDYGNLAKTLEAGETMALNEGFYGKSKITAKDLSSQTPGNLESWKMMQGQTGYSNGQRIAGTMVERGTVSATIGAGENISLPEGHYHGVSVTAKDLKSQTPGNLQAASMLQGQHGYSNGAEVYGSMTDQGTLTETLSAGESVSIPEGHYSGGKITAKDLASQTPGNLEAWQMLTGQYGYSNGKKVSGIMPDRGAFQYAGGIGSGYADGAEYYAFNQAPVGLYRNWSGIEGWAPELRLNKDTVRNFLGVSASKILSGQSIADISGTAPVINDLNHRWCDNTGFVYPNTTDWDFSVLDEAHGNWFLINIPSSQPYVIIRVSCGNTDRETTLPQNEYCCIGTNTWRMLTLRPYATEEGSTNMSTVRLMFWRSSNGDLYYHPMRGTTWGTFTTSIVILASTTVDMSKWS